MSIYATEAIPLVCLKCPIAGLFWFIFGLFKQKYIFLQKYDKITTCIRCCWDSNSEYESPLITSGPELRHVLCHGKY